MNSPSHTRFPIWFFSAFESEFNGSTGLFDRQTAVNVKLELYFNLPSWLLLFLCCLLDPVKNNKHKNNMVKYEYFSPKRVHGL